MHQSSQLDIMFYLHRSIHKETTKNRINYKNKTLTVTSENESAHTSKGPATITTTDYAFDQCLPINDLHSATLHTKHIVTLALKGYSSTILLMNLNPSLASRFIHQQIVFLNSSVAAHNQKRVPQQPTPLKVEYCYISLTDHRCHDLLNDVPISNDDILAHGLDRYMVTFTTLSESSSLLSTGVNDLVPKLIAFKITNDTMVDGYLYLLDLKRPYSLQTPPYPLSANLKALETTVGLSKTKYTEFGARKTNYILDHVLTDLLIGRQQGLLIMDIEEDPQDDDLPQIEKCLSFVKSISSIRGYTSKNINSTWMLDAKIKVYKLENQKLDTKAYCLEMENTDIKVKLKEVTEALAAMEHQHNDLSGKQTARIKELEASLANYKSHVHKLTSQNTILLEKLANTEYALQASNTKSQAKDTTIKKLEQQVANRHSILQEKSTNNPSTSNVADTTLSVKGQATTKELTSSSKTQPLQADLATLDEHKLQLAHVKRNYERQMETASKHHFEAKQLLQEQLSRSNTKCSLLEEELAKLKDAIQGSNAMEINLKTHQAQLREAQKWISLHETTIQHLNSTIDKNNQAYKDAEQRLRGKFNEQRNQLEEMGERYQHDLLQLHQDFETYIQSKQHEVVAHELKLERQGNAIEQYRADLTKQQSIIQKLENEMGSEHSYTIQNLDTIDHGQHQQGIQQLHAEINQQQQLIQEIQTENHEHQQTIQRLQTENNGHERFIEQLQVESREYQQHIKDIERDRGTLLEHINDLENNVLLHETQITTLQETIQDEKKAADTSRNLVKDLEAALKKEESWTRKQLHGMNKERAALLQWIELARSQWTEASAGTTVAATAKSSDSRPLVLTTIFPESSLPSTLRRHVPIYVFPLNTHQKD